MAERPRRACDLVRQPLSTRTCNVSASDAAAPQLERGLCFVPRDSSPSHARVTLVDTSERAPPCPRRGPGGNYGAETRALRAARAGKRPASRGLVGRGCRSAHRWPVLPDPPSTRPLLPRGPGHGDPTGQACACCSGGRRAPSRLCPPIRLAADWRGPAEARGSAGTHAVSAGRQRVPHPLRAPAPGSQVGPHVAVAPPPISLETQWLAFSGLAVTTLSSVRPKMTSSRTPA